MSGRSSDSAPPLMQLALLGGLILLVLVSVLRWRTPIDPNSKSNEATRNTLLASSPETVEVPSDTQPAMAQPTKVVTTGTHKVLCEAGRQGLNLRPTAGLSAPSAILPCGGVLTVTGNPVTADGLLWSPVRYGQSSGWVASYLIRRL
jgi:hypothetical protein